jgi:O-acetyl-ADP-ribose deacetylase (regulator of RNase III)
VPPFFVISDRALRRCVSLGSVQAFPAISTGIYGYPIESATHVAFSEIRKFLDTEEAKEARLVLIFGHWWGRVN